MININPKSKIISTDIEDIFVIYRHCVKAWTESAELAGYAFPFIDHSEWVLVQHNPLTGMHIRSVSMSQIEDMLPKGVVRDENFADA